MEATQVTHFNMGCVEGARIVALKIRTLNLDSKVEITIVLCARRGQTTVGRVFWNR